MWVKICGLTRPSDVEHAAAQGPDALGFVLAASPRQLTPERARALLAHVPEGLCTVAVFRGLDAEQLATCRQLGFDLVQFHGPPPAPMRRATLDGTDPRGGCSWLPAFVDGPDLGDRLAAATPGAVLVDGPLGGGRGILADPARVARHAVGRTLVLAGGLNPDNVGQAIEGVGPFGVDVCSGVEATPGIKDPARVAAFVAAARQAEAR